MLASLAELKAIEHQRIADERAAVEAARDSRAAAIDRVVADRVARRQAEVDAERAARIRIEEAKADAEKQARLAATAAEAAELERHRIALEQERQAAELQLRRELIARKRPTWMIAISAIFGVAAIGLLWLAVQSDRESSAAIGRAQVAEREAQIAHAGLVTAQQQLVAFARQLEELDSQIAALTAKLGTAKTALEVAAVKKDLDAAAKHRADVQRSIDDAKRKRDHDAVTAPMDVGSCAGTTLGCMDNRK